MSRIKNWMFLKIIIVMIIIIIFYHLKHCQPFRAEFYWLLCHDFVGLDGRDKKKEVTF